jgi:hypothetical protein
MLCHTSLASLPVVQGVGTNSIPRSRVSLSVQARVLACIIILFVGLKHMVVTASLKRG